MSQFIEVADFNAGEYFWVDRYALVCGSISVSLSSSMLVLIWHWEWSEYRERIPNIGVSLGCLYYFHAKVCSQITFDGASCHIGARKLICEVNRWTVSCVMWFSPKGRQK